MKVLIIFGSKSDEGVYNEIVAELNRLGVGYEMRVCSAHRTPDELDQILKTTDAKVIIAGAGLAAHLPGVVASKMIVPVIGVPVDSNYKGMDALLSIMQMPPGIPVMSVGVNRAGVAALMASKMLKKYDKVHVFGDEESKEVGSALKVFKEFQVDYEINPEFSSGMLNIKFIDLSEKPKESDDLTIYVPVKGEFDDSAEASLHVLKHSTTGLWVGLGRGDNAALAAIEIMNFDNLYKEGLLNYRKSYADKIKEYDKALK